jgi:predicted nucleotidyltransferase
MQTSLASQLPSIAKLCERYGVAQLELFGSAAGPDFKSEGSDFDFLV